MLEFSVDRWFVYQLLLILPQAILHQLTLHQCRSVVFSYSQPHSPFHSVGGRLGDQSDADAAVPGQSRRITGILFCHSVTPSQAFSGSLLLHCFAYKAAVDTAKRSMQVSAARFFISNSLTDLETGTFWNLSTASQVTSHISLHQAQRGHRASNRTGSPCFRQCW